MLVTSKIQQLYVGYLQSLSISRGLFFMYNTEALSLIRKGMEFDAEGIFADTSGRSKQLKNLSGAKRI